MTLSSGDSFYVDCSLDQARDALMGEGLLEIGGRFVNPAQVAQLTWEVIPSIESPERLQEVV
ncbi:MAG TPA: hypothetical protein VIG47_00660 [Gemmatimonadaceae bacterium]